MLWFFSFSISTCKCDTPKAKPSLDPGVVLPLGSALELEAVNDGCRPLAFPWPISVECVDIECASFRQNGGGGSRIVFTVDVGDEAFVLLPAVSGFMRF